MCVLPVKGSTSSAALYVMAMGCGRADRANVNSSQSAKKYLHTRCIAVFLQRPYKRTFSSGRMDSNRLVIRQFGGHVACRLEQRMTLAVGLSHGRNRRNFCISGVFASFPFIIRHVMCEIQSHFSKGCGIKEKKTGQSSV